MIYTLDKKYIPWTETDEGEGICQRKGTACLFRDRDEYTNASAGQEVTDAKGRLWKAVEHEVEPGCLRWVEQPSQVNLL